VVDRVGQLVDHDRLERPEPRAAAAPARLPAQVPADGPRHDRDGVGDDVVERQAAARHSAAHALLLEARLPAAPGLDADRHVPPELHARIRLDAGLDLLGHPGTRLLVERVAGGHFFFLRLDRRRRQEKKDADSPHWLRF
jgi:hypothetical protein